MNATETELRRSLMALRLEVPESVANHHADLVDRTLIETKARAAMLVGERDVRLSEALRNVEVALASDHPAIHEHALLAAREALSGADWEPST